MCEEPNQRENGNCRGRQILKILILMGKGTERATAEDVVNLRTPLDPLMP